MRSFLFLVIFSTWMNQAIAFDLKGEWVAEESGRSLRLFEHENKFIGSNEIKYVTEDGTPTGDKIEYFYQFNKESQELNGQLIHKGQLETFDSYYSCYLKNGEAEVRWVGENKIDLILPKITFKVVKRYAEREYIEPRPIYCHYYGQEYICGWRNQRVTDRRLLSRECVITSVNPVGVRLVRKNNQ